MTMAAGERRNSRIKLGRMLGFTDEGRGCVDCRNNLGDWVDDGGQKIWFTPRTYLGIWYDEGTLSVMFTVADDESEAGCYLPLTFFLLDENAVSIAIWLKCSLAKSQGGNGG
jgi:hypothetical protein